MKFSHSLILNAVPEWVDYYLDYDHLKKRVYYAEKLKVLRDRSRDEEKPPPPPSSNGTEGYTENAETVNNDIDQDNEMFIAELDKQIQKINNFFKDKFTEILQDASTLREQYDEFGIPFPTKLRQSSIQNNNTSEYDLTKLDSTRRIMRSNSIISTLGFSSPPPLSPEPQQSIQRSNTHHFVDSPSPMNQPSSMTTATDVTSNNNNNNNNNNVKIQRSKSLAGSIFRRHHSPSMVSPEPNIQRRRSTMVGDQLQEFWNSTIHQHLAKQQQPLKPEDMDQYNQYTNFRARCATTYIYLMELKSYIEMNQLGFQKILKKWDKVTGANLRVSYYSKVVATSDPFLPETMDEINTGILLVQNMYAMIFTKGDIHAALSELKLHMRDHIVIERNTVWKDMVGKERLTVDAHAEEAKPGYSLPFGLFITKQACKNFMFLLVAVIVYAVFMSVDVLNDVEASKCLALLLLAALMWAFECIPLHATAYLIPLLIPPMHIVKNDNQVVDAKTASKQVFASMFNGTIMVLFGGFAIAAALSKHGIAKAFASTVLSRAGTRPCMVLLAVMYLATFLSMWISNVATPVLCFSLIQPILRTLPPHSTVGPCLILGIALASCIGGLTSPISSPQNIITIQAMVPNAGWGTWLGTSIPLAIITNLTTWGMLLLYFRPDRSTPHLNVIKANSYSRPSMTQIYVVVVCLATIALWCAESSLAWFWGDNGVIAAIPFVLFFGTEILSKADLNNFLWSVVILAQGGMALSYAVETSGLLDIIGHRIASGVDHLSGLAIVFIFGIIVLVFATFVSHTAAALIIIPIVQQIGTTLSPPTPNLLVMITGLVSSVAMGLPVSGFPNMNAFMQEDPTGKPYLKIKDFILCGIPSSIIAGVITILLGYGISSQTVVG
ncbi:unnamed protein product [Cunninghamella echinulata]